MPFPDVARWPQSEDEWLIAARAAAGLLLIDDAKLYGFVRGGPAIDRRRCEEILAGASEHGITPDTDAVQEAAISIMAGFNGVDEGCLDV